MISDMAFRSMQNVMSGMCFFKLVPYNWDPLTSHLIPITKSWHKILHHFHGVITHGLAIFALVRFVQALYRQMSEGVILTPRVAAMNFLWLLGYSLGSICYHQFLCRGDSIRYFSNSLFDHIILTERKAKGRQKNIKGKQDYFSKIIIFSGLMLVINPPFHSVTMIDTPCAPHFSSSLFLSCAEVEENSHPMGDKILFCLLETYFILLVLCPLSFNWTLIYVGLGWIGSELSKLRERLENKGIDDASIIRKYRYIRYISDLLNDSFHYYLQWYPIILLSIFSFLLYATIKFVHVGWKAYGMFPSCALRCSYESFTPLAIAGSVNKSSAHFLKEWKQKRSFGVKEEKDLTNQLHSSWYRSCKVVECTSGGMYTFENSIVLKSMSNCIQLTLNLLILRKV